MQREEQKGLVSELPPPPSFRGMLAHSCKTKGYNAETRSVLENRDSKVVKSMNETLQKLITRIMSEVATQPAAEDACPLECLRAAIKHVQGLRILARIDAIADLMLQFANMPTVSVTLETNPLRQAKTPFARLILENARRLYQRYAGQLTSFSQAIYLTCTITFACEELVFRANSFLQRGTHSSHPAVTQQPITAF